MCGGNIINEEAETCWEALGCPEQAKKKCSVFKSNAGDKCWRMKNGSCLDCAWFKKNRQRLLSKKI
jgi:hypothetical protein